MAKTKKADLLQLNKSLSWFTANVMHILKNGQIAWVSDSSGLFKKGNGVTMLGALPFLGGGGGGSSIWGAITGTVTDQIDLISYLNTNFIKLSTLLTGLVVAGGTVTSSDSILTAFGKLQNQINSVVGSMTYQGTWNASTNTPILTSSVGTKGFVYRVTTSGSTNLDGTTDWKAGDFVVFNGNTWDKWDATDAVTTVNGYVGNVTLIANDLLLTGYVSGSGAVSATDTVLQAIQKLNGNSSLTPGYVGYGNGSSIITGDSTFTRTLSGPNNYVNLGYILVGQINSGLFSGIDGGAFSEMHIINNLSRVIIDRIGNGNIRFELNGMEVARINLVEGFSYINQYSKSSVPIVILSPPCGAGASYSILGTNKGGRITLNTGTGTTSGGFLVVRMSGGYLFPNSLSVAITNGNINSAGISVYATPNSVTTGGDFQLYTTGFADSTTYVWDYIVEGR